MTKQDTLSEYSAIKIANILDSDTNDTMLYAEWIKGQKENQVTVSLSLFLSDAFKYEPRLECVKFITGYLFKLIAYDSEKQIFILELIPEGKKKDNE